MASPTILAHGARKGTLTAYPRRCTPVRRAHCSPRGAMAYWLCNGIFRKGLKMDLVHGILAREGVMKCLLRVTGGPTYASRRSSVAYKGKQVGLGSGTISLSSPHSVLPHVLGLLQVSSLRCGAASAGPPDAPCGRKRRNHLCHRSDTSV